MRILYVLIETVLGLLRRNISKNSWLWNIMKRIRSSFLSLRLNPISRRKWKSNYAKFESIIVKYSEETDDFFVMQIGACDGLITDPIHDWIEKYRWQGILVEPQREEFEKLRSTYAGIDNLWFENVAVAGTAELRPLYKIKGEGSNRSDYQRATASLLPKQLNHVKGMITTEMVQCVTFATLLDRHQVKRIDLLQVDVEGYDYELLKLFDFGKIKPRLIRYEHMHLKLSERSSCKKYLMRNGYKILEMEYDTGAVLRTGLKSGRHMVFAKTDR